MSTESFAEFSNVVLKDLDLQEQLRTPDNLESFLELTVKFGNERGYAFTAEDVTAAYNTSRRVWFERWLHQ